MMRGDPDLRLAYDRYMAARGVGLRLPWHEIYPAASELDVKGFQQPHEPPLLVDVGGNKGYDAADFKTKNPHIKGRCVVQDLPETFASAPALPEGIERFEYDFFTPQPIEGKSSDMRSHGASHSLTRTQALERIFSRPSYTILTIQTPDEC